ncbi:hypothetical protein L208DRAFT_1386758 [Tricholoma matsutake]|nr:hypothetical protein L208DRAFT_1386758 [Tricholoma matsutake 945]
MVDVSDKIFGLILSAYMDGLCATLEKSRDRAKNNDFLLIGSLPEEMRKGSSGRELPSKLTAKGRNGGRKSTDNWEAALRFAQACCEKFSEPVTSLEDIEKNGNDALTLLSQSVHSIPRASFFTGKDDELSMPSKLKDLADHLVDGMYETSLST